MRGAAASTAATPYRADRNDVAQSAQASCARLDIFAVHERGRLTVLLT